MIKLNFAKKSTPLASFGRAAQALAALALLCTASLPAQAPQNPPATPPASLEISRPVRPWEFMDAVGARAALLGDESGRFEAWVHPLKVLRNFHLIFHAEDHIQAAEPLARTLIVRPESTTIVYASDTFTVRETLVVPLNKPGAVILLDINSTQPMEVEVAFDRDFQMQWPAALSDPDAQPLTAEDFQRMKAVPRAKVIRRALQLTQEEFAARYHIPLGTLRDWEQGRAQPDQPARAYLRAIAGDPQGVQRALDTQPA